MFRKKKPMKIVKVVPTEIDDDDLEEEEVEEEVPTPTQKQVEVSKKNKWKIVEGTLLEDGKVRYTIIADSSIGGIGDEFEY